MSKSILPVFYSRSFKITGLTLKCRIHTECFVYVMWKNGPVSILAYSYPIFPTSCIKESLLPIVYSCLLCCRLIVHSSTDLFLISPVCPINLFVCFCVSTILIWLLWLNSKVWSQGPWYLQLFSQDCFGYWGLLWFHTNFGVIHSSFVKNVISILIGIALNMCIALGSMIVLTINKSPTYEHVSFLECVCGLICL